MEIENFEQIPIEFNFISSNLSNKNVEGIFFPKDNSIVVTGKFNSEFFEQENKSIDYYITYIDGDRNIELVGAITGDPDSGFEIDDNTFIKDIHREIWTQREKKEALLSKQKILLAMNETANEQNKIKSKEIGKHYSDFKSLTGDYI